MLVGCWVVVVVVVVVVVGVDVGNNPIHSFVHHHWTLCNGVQSFIGEAAGDGEEVTGLITFCSSDGLRASLLLVR